jgi:hypothetical protein
MQIDIDAEVIELRRMTTSELSDRYAQVFGEETRTRHKPYLIRKIAWRMQAMAEGDLSIRARRRAEELAQDADVRAMPPKDGLWVATEPLPNAVSANHDPRLPSPGTAITRKYKGRTIQVVVLVDGFEYAGERYASLSALAKAITGSHVNGFRFFNLKGNANE